MSHAVLWVPGRVLRYQPVKCHHNGRPSSRSQAAAGKGDLSVMLTVDDVDFRLRASAFEEVDDLFAIHCAASRPYVEQTWGWDEEWQRQYFSDHFKPSLRQVIVCRETPVGFVDVARTAGRLDLINIEIVAAFQGRKIGTRIIRELIEESERSGVPIHLQVLRKNTRAGALYRRLGFVETSETATHTRMIRSPGGSPTGR